MNPPGSAPPVGRGSTRPQSTAAALIRAGFSEAARAETLLEEASAALRPNAARGEVPTAGSEASEVDVAALVRDLSATADPDLALLSLVRLLERAPELASLLRDDGTARTRVLTVIGASQALGDHLIHHPEHVEEVASRPSRARGGLMPSQDQLMTRIVAAVDGLEGREGMDALRIAYRRELVRIVATDLTVDDASALMPDVGAALADLAAAALAGALQLARAEVEDSDRVRLSIIGMGKCGGRELNYISDVDVMFLVAPAGGDATDGHDQDDEGAAGSHRGDPELVSIGSRLATAVMRICASPTSEGSLWQVDANLRPEGRQGPLVRSIDSYREYYQRWAKTWEFQALLKARYVAGDEDLAEEWLEMVTPMIWSASTREGFVDEVQAMRRRVEDHVPAAQADRQIKLGPGGLRDIEFSVQLLQLVHGRADDALHSKSTLPALEALRDGGYIGREDAESFDSAYRFLRTLEHRIQLYRLRRTHVMPTDTDDLRRLGRTFGFTGDAAAELDKRWRAQQREVRRLHERLFYRPLLAAVAKLSTDDVRLSTEAARARLGALGFRDPAGAMRHIEALTSGVSRRSTIQRHLLPVMLSWFADGADPDSGLLAFRRITDELGGTHWYLGMLRDEGRAAQRLAHVLSSSRYALDLVVRAPETVALLGDPKGLDPVSDEALKSRMNSAVERHRDPSDAYRAIRAVRAKELVRIVLGDLVNEIDEVEVRAQLTRLTEAVLTAGLAVATRSVAGRGEPPGLRMLIVGMGRLGGAELGYASDADIMVVYQPDTLGGTEASDRATAIVADMRKGLTAPGPDPALEIDLSLRPEGKAGPTVRSLDSYRAYYDRWSAGWEAQALLRARPVAGDEQLAESFVGLIDPLRWPAEGLDPQGVVQIRRLKARMEAERLPRGADPKTHFKLGRGGLTDVEWVVQTEQLRHAHRVPSIRRTGTLESIEALVEADLMTQSDAEVLRRSWSLASRLRDVGVLWRGRSVDSVPSDWRDAEGISRILGREPGTGSELSQLWRRSARRCRQVFTRLFYGETDTSGDSEEN